MKTAAFAASLAMTGCSAATVDTPTAAPDRAVVSAESPTSVSDVPAEQTAESPTRDESPINVAQPEDDRRDLDSWEVFESAPLPHRPVGAHRHEDYRLAGALAPNYPPIRPYLQRRIAAFRACYNHYIQIDPALAGRIDTQVTITEDGHVETHVTRDNIGDPGLTRCIENVFLTTQFPRPEGGRIVFNFPLIFSQP